MSPASYRTAPPRVVISGYDMEGMIGKRPLASRYGLAVGEGLAVGDGVP
jgi:hypothetical protein